MSPRLKILLTWCCLGLCLCDLAPSSLRAAQPYKPVFGDPILERWRWRTYLELSGLDAQCIAETPDGIIWFGTANGLWSYDGLEWVRHSTNVGHLVTALYSLPNGVLYAAGGWGISEFRNGVWTALFQATLGRIADIPDIPIKKLAVGQDASLWAATSWGALHHERAGWTLYTDAETAAELRKNASLAFLKFELLPEAIIARFAGRSARRCNLTEICAVGEGRIWFGTLVGEVLCYTPPGNETHVSTDALGAWSVFDQSDGLAPGQITSILTLKDHSIWIAHAGSARADVFDRGAWGAMTLPVVLAVGWQAWQPTQPPASLAAGWVGEPGGKLMQTRDGVVWLSTLYALYAYRDGQWRKYESPQIPIPSSRNIFMQASDGALWIMGSNNETHRVDYQTSRWLTIEDLVFQWESSVGAQWFLHRSGRVVVNEDGRWTSYGIEDGLIDIPVAILGTRSDAVWVAGSHQGAAATARFEKGRWERTLHPDFSLAIEWRATFESSDGSLWFGAFVDTDAPEHYHDGILQYRGGQWIRHSQPERLSPEELASDHSVLLPPPRLIERPIEKFVIFGESRDGRIWSGRNILAFFDGKRWAEFSPTKNERPGVIETMLTARDGDLWIGSREYGALRYDGKEWQQFQGKDSLVANSVRGLAQTTDGSIWAATDRGFSRFDGMAWMPDVLPEELHIPHEGGDLKASPSGELWINHYTLYWMRRAWKRSPPPSPDAEFRTVRHQFHGHPPITLITAGAKVVAQPGNLAVLWNGVMPWREPKDARLQFSHRLDEEPWSKFTSDQGHSFFTLPDGRHQLQVRARDADFNVDPTPATLEFVVLPPVWRQSWFILLMVFLGGLIITQSIRVLLEQARLRRAHDELEVRVRQRTAELEAANRELESFSYSVSHDLRAPLRSIDGFSKVLLEDYAPKLDEEGQANLNRVRAAAQRMGHLIEDMLKLSRVTRGEIRVAPVNLSALVQEIANEHARQEPTRQVSLTVAPDVVVLGDGNLLRIALENLLGNAWKFTAKRPDAKIEFGITEQGEQRVYFVRDNGAGFDMAFAGKLFGAFERLHSPADFPGTGVGLAIVQRVILRHSGRVWAEAGVNAGATFFFTLGDQGRV